MFVFSFLQQWFLQPWLLLCIVNTIIDVVSVKKIATSHRLFMPYQVTLDDLIINIAGFLKTGLVKISCFVQQKV